MSLASEFLKHGAVTEFADSTELAEAAARLKQHGYLLHQVDATSRKSITADLTQALRFMEQFGYAPWGGGLDALADALYGVDYRQGVGAVFLCSRACVMTKRSCEACLRSSKKLLRRRASRIVS